MHNSSNIRTGEGIFKSMTISFQPLSNNSFHTIYQFVSSSLHHHKNKFFSGADQDPLAMEKMCFQAFG